MSLYEAITVILFVFFSVFCLTVCYGCLITVYEEMKSSPRPDIETAPKRKQLTELRSGNQKLTYSDGPLKIQVPNLDRKKVANHLKQIGVNIERQVMNLPTKANQGQYEVAKNIRVSLSRTLKTFHADL